MVRFLEVGPMCVFEVSVAVCRSSWAGHGAGIKGPSQYKDASLAEGKGKHASTKEGSHDALVT